MITTRPARPDDSAEWLQLRLALWPDGSEAEHRDDIDRFFRGEFPSAPWQVLLAESADGRALGFVELSIRPFAGGCRSGRVGYLEGWFVVPEVRTLGVG
jgi:aminoglycoside 6'-N-acetyltransferase I